MNLLKSTGTIGGLTMVSRIAGFAREMLMSRILGAGVYTDAFYVAFRLPNTFRRLFGEGAFSAGFVPLYSQRLQSGRRERSQELLRRGARGFPADLDPVHPGVRARDAAVHLGHHRMAGRSARVRHLPDARSLPLSAADQPGLAVLGHSQQHRALYRSRIRAGAAQSRDALGAADLSARVEKSRRRPSPPR